MARRRSTTSVARPRHAGRSSRRHEESRREFYCRLRLRRPTKACLFRYQIFGTGGNTPRREMNHIEPVQPNLGALKTFRYQPRTSSAAASHASASITSCGRSSTRGSKTDEARRLGDALGVDDRVARGAEHQRRRRARRPAWTGGSTRTRRGGGGAQAVAVDISAWRRFRKE